MLTSNAPTLNTYNVDTFPEQKCSPSARDGINHRHRHRHRRSHSHRQKTSRAGGSAPSSPQYVKRTSSGSDGVDSAPPYRVPPSSSQSPSFASPQPQHEMDLPTPMPCMPAYQKATGGGSDDESAMPEPSAPPDDDDYSIFLSPLQNILPPPLQNILPPPSQSNPPPVAQSITLPSAQSNSLPVAQSISLPVAQSISLPVAQSSLLPMARPEPWAPADDYVPIVHPGSWAPSEDDVNYNTATLPKYQPDVTAPRLLHRGVFCDGPRCRGATQGIVGPRFTCANCPPSVDLCEECYTSRTAHNVSHAFKRFDQPNNTTYTMCPPQQQQPRQEHHSTAFCDGPLCRGATQGIVGPRYVCANCPPSVDLCQRCYSSRAAHNPSHSFKRFDKAGVPAYVMCPPQQQAQSSRVHSKVFCDGPRCRGATHGIVGHRYTCANCPPSVDLCESCYSSQTAHDTSHSFKRFDGSGSLGYVMCPPQQQQQQRVTHTKVFCDGRLCRGATQCIVGPRYVCANCPPTVDLCQRCYSSQAAHNPLHSFKRYDKAGVSAYVICPPQKQQWRRY